MIPFSVDGVLLDIEGTVASIDFVYRQMFPYVRRELRSFLETQFELADVQDACRLIAHESGLAPWSVLDSHPATRAEAISRIESAIGQLMDADAKSTGLKQLQGLIWRKGFESGELVAQLFPDVPDCLRRWTAAGVRLMIYSSGSIEAQKLFFGHTQFGDLRGLLSGYFDTTSGPKREPTSYRRIAEACGLSAVRILFLSDVSAELDAARSANLQVALVVRPGNAPVIVSDSIPRIERLDQLDIRR